MAGAAFFVFSAKDSLHAWLDLSPLVNPWILGLTGGAGALAGFWADRRKERYAWIGLSLSAICLLWFAEYLTAM